MRAQSAPPFKICGHKAPRGPDWEAVKAAAMTELHGEKVNTVVDGVAKKDCIPCKCIKYSSDRLYTEASDFSLGCIPHIGEYVAHLQVPRSPGGQD